ncbi:MAG: hypothetical protein H0V47_10185 [Chloroflexia bacterium]|jgi:hypothetical protein|nr:hypothetical protein [Chloroflexia bacterium]
MILYRKLALVLALAASLVLAGGSTAAASHNATHDANVGNLLSGLINVNVSDVTVNIEDNNVQLVNVEDSLNDNEVRILNNVLNNNEVASRNQDVLNNLLRDANIITDNQVVVGVLSGGQLVVQDLVQ